MKSCHHRGRIEPVRLDVLGQPHTLLRTGKFSWSGQGSRAVDARNPQAVISPARFPCCGIEINKLL